MISNIQNHFSISEIRISDTENWFLISQKIHILRYQELIFDIKNPFFYIIEYLRYIQTLPHTR